MNNKKTVYFLLPAVVVIWAIIGYRIINGLSAEPPQKKYYQVEQVKQVAIDTMSYPLSLNYRDPFYTAYTPKAVTKKIVKTKSAPKKAPSKRIIKSSSVDWSKVKYFGMIKDPKSQKQSALLIINGSYQYVAPGMIIDEFEIKSITSDSVGMVSDDELKYIRKN